METELWFLRMAGECGGRQSIGQRPLKFRDGRSVPEFCSLQATHVCESSSLFAESLVSIWSSEIHFQARYSVVLTA